MRHVLLFRSFLPRKTETSITIEPIPNIDLNCGNGEEKMFCYVYSVVEVKVDVEYQVEFDAGDKRMAIMVSLSPEFPLEKPVLRVSPPVNHLWCNEHSEITSAPGLLNVRSSFQTLISRVTFL